jgi:hypothetical protein
VGAGTLEDAGLECTLHDDCSENEHDPDRVGKGRPFYVTTPLVSNTTVPGGFAERRAARPLVLPCPSKKNNKYLKVVVVSDRGDTFLGITTFRLLKSDA